MKTLMIPAPQNHNRYSETRTITSLWSQIFLYLLWHNFFGSTDGLLCLGLSSFKSSVMGHLEKNVEIMNDLLAIQHERIAVYQVFMKYPVNDETVYKMFRLMADHSRNCLFQLRSHITTTKDPAGRIEMKGEIYSNWPGMRYFGPESSPADIFSCCEYNEQLTADAYEQALAYREEIGPELQAILDEQFQLIKRSSEFIQLQKEKPLQPAATMEERIPFLFSRGYSYESYEYS